MRPELMEYFDFTVFVEAAFEVTVPRAIQRDRAVFGRAEEVRRSYEERYIPGQKLYLEECQPKERAMVVVDNNNPSLLSPFEDGTGQGEQPPPKG